MNSNSETANILFVAPWGDFTKYKETSYIPPGTDQEVRSKTSLIPLITHVLNSPDFYDETRYEILILVQETLAATLLPSELDRLYNEGGEYTEVYRKVLNSLEKEVFEHTKELDFPKHPSIKILPGIGSFSYNRRSGYNGRTVSWKFNKNIERKVTPFGYYASIALLHILSTLYKLGGNDKSSVHIHFDSTHGINYTGTATYRALLTAARVYSASTDSTIRISFYNSDPYIRGVNRPLHIWNVRNEYITSKKALSRLLYTYLLVDSNMSGTSSLGIKGLDKVIITNRQDKTVGQKKRKLLKSDINYIDRINSQYADKAFVGAYLAAPLLLLQTGYELKISLSLNNKSIGELFKTVIKEISNMLPIVRIYHEHDSLIIEHQAALHYDYMKSYLAGFSAISYSFNTWKNVFDKENLIEYNSSGNSKVLWVTLEELNKAKDRIVGPLRQIVLNELDRFQVLLEKKPGDIGKIYTDFKLVLLNCKLRACLSNPMEGVKVDIDNPRTVDHRIFTAHAGLSMNLLSLLCKGNTIYVSYNEKIITDTLQKVAQNLLKDVKEQLESKS